MAALSEIECTDNSDITLSIIVEKDETQPTAEVISKNHGFDVSTVFTNTHLAKDILGLLHEQRKREQLTDVILKSGDLKIPCHRSILAASSPFFQAMFLNDLRESYESVIHLHDVKPDMLKIIIDYLYLGRIEIRLSFAGDLLATACFLQYPKIVAQCESFLQFHLHPSNCLGVHQLADSYSRQNLMSEAWNYILNNFMQILLTKEFLLMEGEKLIQLISDKRLDVTREDIVLNACLKWVNFDQHRIKCFNSVLECVRLEFVCTSTLKDILMSNYSFINEEKCKNMITHSLNLQEMMVKGKLLRHPRPSMLQDIVVVVGGMTTDRIWQKDVIFYHEGCWHFLTTLPFDHTDYSVTSIKEEMYIIGGFNEGHVCNFVWKYSFADNEWKQIASLQKARCNHASTSVNGKVYVVAGEDNDSTLTSIEVYDPEVRSWSIIGDINPTNSNISLAALYDKLYVVGPLSFTRVCSIQVFDLETLECTVILTSGMTRAMFPVLSLKQHLYLLGNCKMKEVTVLDPKTMEMFSTKPMRYKRNCPTATVVSGKIVVTGGELQQHVQKVESFDPSLNEWVGEAPMPKGLCFHGCATGLKYLGPPFKLSATIN